MNFLLTRQNRGWLTNPQRKERQQKSLAFTDKDVQGLLNKIEGIQQYCKPTLGERIDQLLRQRDRRLFQRFGFGSKEVMKYYR